MNRLLTRDGESGKSSNSTVRRGMVSPTTAVLGCTVSVGTGGGTMQAVTWGQPAKRHKRRAIPRCPQANASNEPGSS
jgi:hypothetical protein